MKPFFTIIAFLILAFEQPTIAQTSAKGIADTTAQSGVVIHGDTRLALLEKGQGGGSTAITRKRGGSYNTRGFRVQIYSGTDRAKATQIKVDFIRRFPGTPSYLQFVSPQFRVKVGNFKSRQEAAEFYRQVNGTYSPCMIVPDNVMIRN